MIKSKSIYITKADKGGAILILNTHVVNGIMMQHLEDPDSFRQLDKDPRPDIKERKEKLIKKWEDKGEISDVLRFYMTGKTNKEGVSPNPVFSISSPYIYPLFKLHKLSAQDITDKVIPPTRMLTGSTSGPTYRLGIFIDTLLQPLAITYCGTELLKDTTTFLQNVDQNKDILTESGMNVCTLDFDALYPSIRKDLALMALSHALDKSSIHSETLNL